MQIEVGHMIYRLKGNRLQLPSWTWNFENACCYALLFSRIFQDVGPHGVTGVLLAQLLCVRFPAPGSLNHSHYLSNGQIEDIS